MSSNRGVVYIGFGKVEVQNIVDFGLYVLDGCKIEYGVILKVILMNICGLDQYMVCGCMMVEFGLVLGYEIIGEVIEKGVDVEMLDIGDIVFVFFNVVCGCCCCCCEGDIGVCLIVNLVCVGGVYGYVDMGGWIGGQVCYVMVFYVDFNLLKFLDCDRVMLKIFDLIMLLDILFIGFYGVWKVGVGVGLIVYVVGVGLVGLVVVVLVCILGVVVVMIGDFNKEWLEYVCKVGFELVDLFKGDNLFEMIVEIIGSFEVDVVIDVVGFEVCGYLGGEQFVIVLNQMMQIICVVGNIGIFGFYVIEDFGVVDDVVKQGSLLMCFGLGWVKV